MRLVAAAICVGFCYACSRVLGLWRIRLWTATAIDRIPAACPSKLRVLPPPPEEYVGVWAVDPAEARRQFAEDLGFDPLARAYLHGHTKGGQRVYEVGSFAHRPDGRFGEWQLHVRLFPAEGDTELWAHWERNPYVAPLAHLREEGYDPGEGRARIREAIRDPIVDERRPTASK